MSLAEKKATLQVHLQPGAKSNELVGLKDSVLWARVAAPRTRGQANKALLGLLAQALALPQKDLALIRGHTSRHKVIAIQGLNPEEFKKRLARSLPQKELPQR